MIPAMDIGSVGLGAVIGLGAMVNLAWHVAVIVFLYKIWQRVKHLPS